LIHEIQVEYRTNNATDRLITKMKLIGPLNAVAASGAIANALIFTNHAGGTRVKKFAKPRNPRSAAQTGIRAMMAFLNHEWPTLSPDELATWSPASSERNLIAATKYKGVNLNRWGNFLGASRKFPATEDDLEPGHSVLFAVYQKPTVILLITINPFNDLWFFAVHRSQDPAFEAKHTNCIAADATFKPPGWWYYDYGLPPGVYYYRVSLITNAGRLLPVTPMKQVTVS